MFLICILCNIVFCFCLVVGTYIIDFLNYFLSCIPSPHRNCVYHLPAYLKASKVEALSILIGTHYTLQPPPH